MIRFSCPNCGTSLKSSEDKIGTKTACPRCGERFQVPSSEDPEDAGDLGEEAAERGSAKTAVIKKTGKGSARDRSEGKKSNTTTYVIMGIGGAMLVAGVVVGIIIFSGNGNKPVASSTNQVNNPALAGNTQVAGLQPGNVGLQPTTTAAGNPGIPPLGGKPATDIGKKPSDTEVAVKSPGKEESPATPGNAIQPVDVYKRLLKSIAWIVLVTPTGSISGSGSLVDAENRLILTNYHVVYDYAKGQLTVQFPEYRNGEVIKEKGYYEKRLLKGQAYPAQVVLLDERRDLALVQVRGLDKGIKPLRLSPTIAQVGHDVHSMGSPGASGSLWVYTRGSVRTVYEKEWVYAHPDGLQECKAIVVETSSPINPGDSGGPMVNEHSDLVAVTSGSRRDANSINHFIDVREVQTVMAKWYRDNKKTPPQDMSRPEVTGDVKSLVKNLESSEIPVRQKAATDLKDMGPDGRLAVPALVKALKDADDTVRKHAAEALEQIGFLNQMQLPVVAEALKDPNLEVRAAAASALARMGEEAESQVPALIEALKDPETQVRVEVMHALGKIGPVAKDAVPELAKALKDNSPDIRGKAAQALARMGADAKPAINELGEILVKDHNFDVKMDVLAAITEIGPDAGSVVPQLNKCLKERSLQVRQRTLQALAAIGPDAKDSINEIVPLMDERNLHPVAVETLVKIGKDTIPALRRALAHKSWMIRLGAVDALGKFGSDAQSAYLDLAKLATRDPKVEVQDKAKTAMDLVRGKKK